ncbi:MAG: molybdenum cofactor guanylyltransferase [Erythrobacter sp.]
MRILGAILAGGKARRFGSDKAQALYRGERLIDCVARSLRGQTNAVVLCGRVDPDFSCLEDRPNGDLGPLGGLCAALNHAHHHGYTHVLSTGVDAPDLPVDLYQTLTGADTGNRAAIVGNQPVIGLWPAPLCKELDAFLAQGGRALYGFAEQVNARRITFDPPLMNVNRPADLGDNQP